MKNYTRDEYIEARKKLTKPVNDFFDSKELIAIYRGIFAKYKLNFNQAGLVSDIANATLMGLESEAVLETNLHQMLPELSNAATHELVADINDRLFKEARRRVQENIVAPEPVWDEEELGKKPEENDPLLLSDEALDALAEKEKIDGWKDPDEADRAKAEQERLNPPVVTPEETADLSPSSIVAEKLGLVTDVPNENKTDETGVPVTPISEEKLGEETKKTAPTETPAPIKPQATETPKPAYKGGVDPYREPVE
ncbi:hypothetical protein EPO14_04110 [Patescibacteria group bacterium]|nr:MAG: hypothetical protein EPO14_04110 [Patescibacteria group bacterium]